MNISIIIPTLNREPYFIRTIKDLLYDSQESEIVVVDQSDCKLEISNHFIDLKELSRIKYFPVKFKSLLQARNFGWQHARCEKIIFCDDDVLIYPGFTLEHFKSLDLPGVGIVAGGIEQDGKSFDSKIKPGVFKSLTAIPVRNYASKKSCYTDLAPGGNFSIKKDVVIHVGGFDATLERGAALYEETDFCLCAKRLGYKVYFNANARLKHLAISSGGCRVTDPNVYVNNLARNRAIIIMRYVPVYFKPISFLYLIKLIVSYTMLHHNAKIFLSSLPCIIDGIRLSFFKASIINEK